MIIQGFNPSSPIFLGPSKIPSEYNNRLVGWLAGRWTRKKSTIRNPGCLLQGRKVVTTRKKKPGGFLPRRRLVRTSKKPPGGLLSSGLVTIREKPWCCARKAMTRRKKSWLFAARNDGFSNGILLQRRVYKPFYKITWSENVIAMYNL